ncbi:hypothetical protein Prudu_008155 [Prunus dulcis]|uniref:Uncharacterized protein n=1 Tax=Prunus dulcis TaxID=3755 RepID=A0A4Y1R3K2_PRUDU|nr:hypothetical protein Prudu_008155 [Prunus dulcis]
MRNTKRVNRRRHRHRRRSQFRDIEQGYSSREENDLWDNYHELNVSRKRKSLSRRRKDKLQSSVYPSRRHGTRSHHHVRLKSRGRSVRIVGRSQRPRSSRHLRLRKVRNVRRQARTSKRRKLSPQVSYEQFHRAAAFGLSGFQFGMRASRSFVELKNKEK